LHTRNNAASLRQIFSGILLLISIVGPADKGRWNIFPNSYYRNLCSYTDYFEVIANEVPIIENLITLGTTSYQVIATGSQKILYSIDDINWQESHIFENLNPDL